MRHPGIKLASDIRDEMLVELCELDSFDRQEAILAKRAMKLAQPKILLITGPQPPSRVQIAFLKGEAMGKTESRCNFVYLSGEADYFRTKNSDRRFFIVKPDPQANRRTRRATERNRSRARRRKAGRGRA